MDIDVAHVMTSTEWGDPVRWPMTPVTRYVWIRHITLWADALGSPAPIHDSQCQTAIKSLRVGD